MQPPTTLYVGLNDAIRVRTINPNSVTYVLEIRLLLPDGTISVQEENFVNAQVSNAQNNDFRLAEGFILSVALNASTSPSRGGAYATIAILRTFGAANAQAFLIAAGYVTGLRALAWPTVLIDSPTARPGLLNSHSVGNPAAGADWTYTQAAGTRSRIQAITAVLTTSAAVANRQVTLTITVNSVAYSIAVGATQAASLSVRYSFGPGAPTQAAVIQTRLSTGLPVDLSLASANTISVSTAAIDVADQWSAINFATEDNFDF